MVQYCWQQKVLYLHHNGVAGITECLSFHFDFAALDIPIKTGIQVKEQRTLNLMCICCI